MPRPKLPADRALVSGAVVKNPKRYPDKGGRRLPKLGAPSPWLTGGALEAWHMLQAEIPWARESDRAVFELTALVRGPLIEGREVGVSRLNLLRMLLAQLGATPADAGKVRRSDDEEAADPSDQFFH